MHTAHMSKPQRNIISEGSPEIMLRMQHCNLPQSPPLRHQDKMMQLRQLLEKNETKQL
jgi:hypothetical protein